MASIAAEFSAAESEDKEADQALAALQEEAAMQTRLFRGHQESLAPEGAKALDAIRDLLTSFPTYPVQISGFTDDQGKTRGLAGTRSTRCARSRPAQGRRRSW